MEAETPPPPPPCSIGARDTLHFHLFLLDFFSYEDFISHLSSFIESLMPCVLTVLSTQLPCTRALSADRQGSFSSLGHLTQNSGFSIQSLSSLRTTAIINPHEPRSLQCRNPNCLSLHMLKSTRCCLESSAEKSQTISLVRLVTTAVLTEELTYLGSPLNRVSFLRKNHVFLSAALKHPSTSFLLFNNLSPLVKDPTKLEYASFKDIQPLVGEDPYSKPEEELVAEYNSSITTPQLLFLGLDEHKESGFEWTIYHGSPYFALDVTPKGTMTSAAEKLIDSMKSRGLQFVEGRMHMSLPADQAAIYAQARALLDWNARNPFCAQCGHPTLSINAGTKRTCPPKDIAFLTNNTSIGSTTAATPGPDRPDCATRKGVSNLCFPRTDPVCTFYSKIFPILPYFELRDTFLG